MIWAILAAVATTLLVVATWPRLVGAEPKCLVDTDHRAGAPGRRRCYTHDVSWSDGGSICPARMD